MKTHILYEEELFIVCQKPAGFPVQSARVGSPDVESELKIYLHQNGIKNPYLAVIHRLDQPVRGILVFAKTKAAAADLSAQLRNGKMKKIYRACVYGCLQEKEGTLKDILIRENPGNISRILSELEWEALSEDKRREAKEAVLSFKKVEKAPYLYPQCTEGNGNATELEICLGTGRHHQIRVQLAGNGHPILGDLKYGSRESKKEAERLGVTDLCLTAYRLAFRHPRTGKQMEFVFDPNKNNFE